MGRAGIGRCVCGVWETARYDRIISPSLRGSVRLRAGDDGVTARVVTSNSELPLTSRRFVVSTSRPTHPVPMGRATRVFVVLIGVSAVIVLGNLFIPWWSPPHEVRIYLDIGNEVSLPTWWNTSLLVVAGVLMLLVSGGSAGRRERTAWRMLGGIVLLMSLDEASMLHERLALVGLHWWPDAGLNYMWLALGVPLAAAVVLFIVLLSRALPGRARWAVLGAFGIYFTGAIGAEVAQELVLQVDGHWFVRHFLAHVEEGLEMTGAALLLVTALARLHPPRIMEEAGASEASDARFERRAADLNESSARLPAAAEQHHDAPAEASSSSIAPRRP